MEIKKRLILHIGTDKTGSTFIQNTLFNNRAKLMEHGVYYPESFVANHSIPFHSIFRKKKSIDFHVMNYYNCTKKEEVSEKLEKQKKLWIELFEIFNANPNLHTFIISGEALCHNMQVKETYEFVSKHFDKVDIFGYFREVTSFVNSLTKHKIRTRVWDFDMVNDSEVFDSLLEITVIKLTRPLLLYEEFFGKESINLRLFNREYFINNDIIDDIMGFILPNEKTVLKRAVNASNESVGYYCLLLMSQYRKYYPYYNSDGSLIKENSKDSNLSHIMKDIDKPANIPIPLSDRFKQKVRDEYLPVLERYGLDPASMFVEKESTNNKTEEIPMKKIIEIIKSYDDHIDKLEKNIAHLIDRNEVLKNTVQTDQLPEQKANLNLYSTKSRLKCFWEYLKFKKSPNNFGFDKDYYLKKYPDVASSGQTPLKHFVFSGVAEGRNPNAKFNTLKYVKNNPEVFKKLANPLIHSYMYKK